EPELLFQSSFFLSLKRTGAEPRPNVATIRRVEVSIAVINELRTSRPTATAKDLVIPKPRFGILFVRTGDEAGIRSEVAGRPFPYVADHLPASKRAITARQRVNRDASQRTPVK